MDFVEKMDSLSIINNFFIYKPYLPLDGCDWSSSLSTEGFCSVAAISDSHDRILEFNLVVFSKNFASSFMSLYWIFYSLMIKQAGAYFCFDALVNKLN